MMIVVKFPYLNYQIETTPEKELKMSFDAEIERKIMTSGQTV